jgi:hypothetical protein
MIKFRFMVVNADKTGVTSAFGDNRRITSVRRFVRAYKIDELIKALDAAKSSPVLSGGKRVLSSVPGLLLRAERPESCIRHSGA